MSNEKVEGWTKEDDMASIRIMTYLFCMFFLGFVGYAVIRGTIQTAMRQPYYYEEEYGNFGSFVQMGIIVLTIGIVVIVLVIAAGIFVRMHRKIHLIKTSWFCDNPECSAAVEPGTKKCPNCGTSMFYEIEDEDES